MSFTTDIKNEISNNNYNISEKQAELSAVLNMALKLEKDYFYIETENLSIARYIFKLIKDIYHIEITLETNEINRLGRRYLATLIVKEKKDFILKDLSIINEENKRIYIPESFIIGSDSEKQAYLRGTFLICGSINDPASSRYHAEFVIENIKTSKFISKLLQEFNFNNKVLKREKYYMVYIKESETISDFIKLLGAYNSLFYYEDIRIYRDHKNMTNRLNNCEQANVDKIINSSNRQLENIKKLKEKIDFDLLDDRIKDICIYKEKYPESSMQELADIISVETGKKITKSGINHRLRKINELIK